jgi:hypothetical protein
MTARALAAQRRMLLEFQRTVNVEKTALAVGH